MAGTGSGSESGEAGVPRIVKTEDVLGGDPRIEGHRVGVYHVYQRYAEGGETPEEIDAGYDISVAEVHAALAYAFENASEMRDIDARNRRRITEEESQRVVPDESPSE